MIMAELSLTIVKGTLRGMGELTGHPKYFVEIKGIGNFKHNLSYNTEKEAISFIQKMAKMVATAYMKESVRKQGRY
jgi:hypothetical protein